MSMQDIVNEQMAQDEATQMPGEAKRSNGNGYVPAGEQHQWAKLDGLVALSVQAETAADGTLEPSVQVVIADVGGKFLLNDLCNLLHYQASSLDKRVMTQRTSLLKMIETDRVDEQFDERIANLEVALRRNRENLKGYEAGLAAAAKLFCAYTGEVWVPRSGRVDPSAAQKTAARADAAALLKELEAEKPIKRKAA